MVIASEEANLLNPEIRSRCGWTSCSFLILHSCSTALLWYSSFRYTFILKKLIRQRCSTVVKTDIGAVTLTSQHRRANWSDNAVARHKRIQYHITACKRRSLIAKWYMKDKVTRLYSLRKIHFNPGNVPLSYSQYNVNWRDLHYQLILRARKTTTTMDETCFRSCEKETNAEQNVWNIATGIYSEVTTEF